MDEENRLAGRMRRYAGLAGALGGIAARAAGGQLLGRRRSDAALAADLRAALGGLKGPAMKVAQLLATIPDALPADYAREFTQLQAQAPAMGWPFVKRRMGAELGPDWQARFAYFEHSAAAAASLGQVHRARSLEGADLAVKLQYPDMASVIEADLRQLGLVLGLFRRHDPSIDTREVAAEIAARLREELDYALEAKHMALYRHMLAETPHIHVPEPLPSLSTNRLLTMTWLEGRPLLSLSAADEATRNHIAATLFRAWYVPFHHFGVIHGDPHLGNYTLADDFSLNLLDFGCVRIFAPAFVGGVIDLYHALRDNDAALAVHAYETWGFRKLSKPLIETLNIWAAFLYGPLLEDRPRLIAATDKLGLYGREQAMKVRRRLQALGPITPPREFVFMDRAAIGLGGVFARLQARVNWHRLFEEIIAGFAADTLRTRQSQALERAGLPPEIQDKAGTASGPLFPNG
ncbi:MAG: ABC1 kinase family protein [Pseudomonadota bacterium]